MREILFSKYSIERSPQFAIRTSIVRDGERRWVEKAPMTQDAAAHVERLATSYDALCRIYEGTRVRPCPVTVENGLARFEFQEGRSFHERLERLIAEKDEEGILALCKEFESIVRSGAGVEKFRKTPEFVHVFGDVELPDGLTAMPFSNVDWIFENLIEDENGDITLIDYEWCFDFPVPLEYVLYRSLYNTFARWEMQKFLGEVLCPQVEISKELIPTLWQMEMQFTQYVAQGVNHAASWYGYVFLRKKVYDWQGEIEIIRQEGEQQRQELVQQYEEERQRLTQQYEETIRKKERQYEAVLQEKAALCEQLETQSNQYRQMMQKKQILQEQCEEFQAQRKVYCEHIQKKDAYIDELELHIQQLEEQHHQLLQNMEQLQACNISLQEQYRSILQSQCWKITKPIRIMLDAIRKTWPGMLLHKTAHSLRVSGLRITLRNIKIYLASKRKQTESHYIGIGPESILEMMTQIVDLGGKVYNQGNLLDPELPPKKMLLISHELNLTGAPIALGYFAKAVQKQGYLPVLVSPHDGALRKQLIEIGFPILIYKDLFQTNFIPQCAGLFDLVVVCTNVGAPIVSKLNGRDISVLWWIHEARISYHPGAVAEMPETLKDNIHVYCGGPYAEQILKEYRPAYSVKQLLYFVPDYASNLPDKPSFSLRYANGKTVFVMVGMQEERKGQDILVQAIRILDPESLKQSLFVFVGKAHYKPIQRAVYSICEDYPRNVQYIEELSRADLTSLYMQMDCLICTSRDDPMPTVVTEAMVMSKAIICSGNSGSAALLEQMKAGLLYHNNDPAELAQCIKFVCAHKGADLLPMCRRARKTYESFFSQDRFEQSIEETIADIQFTRDSILPFHGTVSVVIPTYNAGESIVSLIGSLQEQEGVSAVEIIVVDSESKDGTAEKAETLGAKVIRIRQVEFSHSFARNLGADSASGEYLLFMTQDALPNGSQWICKLLQPQLRGEAVAVSCKETPRQDCDLMGKISIWCHSEYLGVLQTDRIMRLPIQTDYDSLRKNAQLNDVACLVQRELFLQFKYRGDYAEDLDLGLRLIRAGYTLALLSSVQVVHSHTRPPLYHIKRTLVDLKTLKAIFPDMPVEAITAQTVANRAITAYCVLILYTKAALACSEESWESFFQWSETYYKQLQRELLQTGSDGWKRIMQSDYLQTNRDIQLFTKRLFEEYRTSLALDLCTAESLIYFLTHVVSRYLKAHSIRFADQIREEIIKILPKYLGQLFGSLLASYTLAFPEEDGLLHEMIQEYSANV